MKGVTITVDNVSSLDTVYREFDLDKMMKDCLSQNYYLFKKNNCESITVLTSDNYPLGVILRNRTYEIFKENKPACFN